MTTPRVVFPRFALVTAPGCYAGPDTCVHAVYETLTEARRHQNKRQVVVLCTEDEDYMVPGYRFTLNARDIIRR